ncbi:hypothetical protein COCOBI_08-2360 [Coccomyxa sp. Obi]|nr:hypothetical protein COCOBI_08-2360 [Coccomyxa sp. Obi]
MAKLQSSMHAKLEESQQKSRVLRKDLTVKERELELARKTIGRLSNERTLIQGELEADRARLKRMEGTLSDMRRLSDTKANTQEYKAKIQHLKEELEVAEERANAEHQLAEIRRQEVQQLQFRNDELQLGSKVTDEILLPNKGTPVAKNEGDACRCEALQCQISSLTKAERIQRYVEKMDAAGTAIQHELQEHASKSQV